MSLLPEWWLPASVGYAAGMLTAPAFRQLIQEIHMGLFVRAWRYIHDRIHFSALVIIMLSLSVGTLGWVTFDNRGNVERLARCTREYNDESARTAGPRTEANAVKDEALARFVNSLDPLFERVRDPKASEPTKQEIRETADAVTAFKIANTALERVREKYPPPPPPNVFCEESE